MKNRGMGNNVNLHSIFHHLDALVKWKKGEYFPPVYVDISPTSCCNHSCPFCFTEWRRENAATMPRDMIIRVFREMGEAGVKVCEVQGEGEPFLNPAVTDAIVAGSDAGLKICVVTNGAAISEIAMNKIMPRLSFLRFSNVEHTPALYARTHGCPERDFYRALAAINRAVLLKRLGNLPVVITATVLAFKYNVGSLVKTVEMLRGFGVDMVHIKAAGHMAHNKGQEWESATWDDVKDSAEEAKRLETESFKVNVRSDYFDFYENKKKCYDKCRGVEFAVHISAEGKIYPCYTHWGDERYCLGDLNKASFGEIWRGDERKTAMERFYAEVNPNECGFFCKQHTINEVLAELAEGNRGVF